ncbi:hypothetical protein Lfu02_47200 [Longispora fulva]|uniref:Lhr-like helicase n=1 Tax=Longispora fulva TaxID=619741 RepID=A0A8J7GL53_9ACTN|nr:hypothetical protein [Longispora fulva]MBG6138095.1 Lhr-like helicase [Longispora fulva]GIG60348.1 hypothetical protein Lfu02_47200 [Longispora fulva]
MTGSGLLEVLARPGQGCQVLYVSTLPDLAAAIAPLGAAGYTVGVRDGDTPTAERRVFARRPPDVLATTPESLYLLLTSRARVGLTTVRTVVLAGPGTAPGPVSGAAPGAVSATKRGAHLALSLERLDVLLPAPVRRIGLPASPPGHRPEVTVEAPVIDIAGRIRDLTRPGPPATCAAPHHRAGAAHPNTVEASMATVVFVATREEAERLAARLNEDARLENAMLNDPRLVGALPTGDPARAHHGAMARGPRARAVADLRAGRLAILVATGTPELGLAPGSVDLVVQVGTPPTVEGAAHRLGLGSRAVLLPRDPADLLAATALVDLLGSGTTTGEPAPGHLDVLAQQVTAMVAMDDWTVPDLGALIRRAAPFAGLPAGTLHAVLDLLAGQHPAVPARLTWDRDADTLTARHGAHRLAVRAGRDRTTVPVLHGDTRIGELDENPTATPGDVLLLGSAPWRIEETTPRRVLVTPAPGHPAHPPTWSEPAQARCTALGRAVGAYTRTFTNARSVSGLTSQATEVLAAHMAERRAAGPVPDDRTVVLERHRDDDGWHLTLHSVLGGRVNAAWALALTARLRARHALDTPVTATDTTVVLDLPDMVDARPTGDLFLFRPDEIASVVSDAIGTSALFADRFRECAARALLLPDPDPGRPRPAGHLRHRAAELWAAVRDDPGFPITQEATDECLALLDVPALTTLMADLTAGRARLLDTTTLPGVPCLTSRSGPDTQPGSGRDRRVVGPRDPAGRAVSGRALAAFLPGWQGVGSGAVGTDGLLEAVRRLQGCVLPVADLESRVLPARVDGYTPALLDELCLAGELVWAGHGDGRVALYLPEDAPLLLPPAGPVPPGAVHGAILAALADRALFLPALVTAVAARVTTPEPDDLPATPRPDSLASAVQRALLDLTWAGHVSNDTLAPVRRGGRTVAPGRWYRPVRETDPGRLAAAQADLLLHRYGVLAPASISEQALLDAHPTARPGHHVTCLGVSPGVAARPHTSAGPEVTAGPEAPAGPGPVQYALPGALVPLRSAPAGSAVVLAACDPANPFGVLLPWPDHPHPTGPERRAGAVVVLVGGRLVLHVDREVLRFTADASMLATANRLLGSGPVTGG